MIDLRSDTVTQPCEQMRALMATAEVGDDVYAEDPAANKLEEFAAELLGKPAAIYVSSGTQSNLLALLCHCQRGDEYIVGQQAHTYRFEGGGAAVLGGIQPQPLPFESDGSLDLFAVQQNIKPPDFHFAKTRLLALENTQSGKALPQSYIAQARKLCDESNLNLHLDGARFFNAVIANQTTPTLLAQPFDSVSICLSKGLGAPIGSILVGEKDFISEARRWRKMLGGGMRQVGIVASAGLYALENNCERLIDDHNNAEAVASGLEEKFGGIVEQHTNMIHLSMDPDIYRQLQAHLLTRQIRVERPRWRGLRHPTGNVGHPLGSHPGRRRHSPRHSRVPSRTGRALPRT